MASRRSCRLLNTASLVFTLSLAAAVASCSSSLPVDSVALSGEQRIPSGVSTQLSAIASTAHGRIVHDVTTSATWTSSDPSVASVSAGLVQALRPGVVTIRATRGGGSGTLDVTVTGATLTSIDIGPAFTLPKGVGKRLTATGTFSDLSTRDLTTSVTWSTSVPSIATVSNDGGSSGLVTSVAPGVATITAADPATGIAGAAAVTVSSAQLVSIAITPNAPSVPLGTTQQLTAVGTYSDTTTQDITASVSWSSSELNVATVSTTGGARGLASTHQAGTATVTATDLGSGLSSSTVLTVTAARLASLAITPPAASIALGRTQQFSATGTYTDATTRDLTGSVTWESSSSTVAQVTSAAGAGGLATSTGVGSARIKATEASSGLSATATLTVTAAQLVSISVTPAAPSTPLGVTTQFTATGTYTDTSTQDLTANVTWEPSNASVATVSNAASTKGLATTLSAGTTTITATDSVSGISGSTMLTVTAARLASLSITPATPSIPSGLTVRFTATGKYTDASTQDVTTLVTWSSSAPAIASVSNTTGSQGVATAGATGTTTLSAVDPATKIQGSTTLTVTDAQLVSIAVTPQSPSIAAGQTQQFTATGTYTDSSTHDLTVAVTWSSSDPNVATISNAAGSQGLATAAVSGSGTTTISATIPGTSPPVAGTATLTVTH